MNKYKVGDKVVMEITDEISVMEEPDYILSDATVVNKGYIDKAAEPLSTYTEPLEAKISRQAAAITRLLEENKELKEDKAVLNAKIDAYKLYGDQHEEEYNQTFNQGAEAAWELARKIVLKNGYSAYDLHEIFNCCGSHQALEDYTYPEAAAKVAEWERQKEEIKAGDVVRFVFTDFYNPNKLCDFFDTAEVATYDIMRTMSTALSGGIPNKMWRYEVLYVGDHLDSSINKNVRVALVRHEKTDIEFVVRLEKLELVE